MDMHTQIHSTFHTYFYLCAFFLEIKTTTKTMVKICNIFGKKKFVLKSEIFYFQQN